MITVTKEAPDVKLLIPDRTAGYWRHAVLSFRGQCHCRQAGHKHESCHAGLCGFHKFLPVVPDADVDNGVIIAIPDNIPNGQYRLTLHPHGPCRDCYVVNLNAMMHEPPVSPTMHAPTDPTAGDTIIECCESIGEG